MRYAKPALAYEKQLDLIKERGLIVRDEERALNWLRRVGYYRLSAYFLPFKVPGTDTFKSGRTFDDVIDLYRFDANLRMLAMEAIYQVEVAIRASVTYHFGHVLGPFGYIDPANYAPFVPSPGPGIPARGFDFGNFAARVQREIEQSSEDFVRHYRTKYTLEKHLPIWMATELMSVGTLSKMTEYVSKSLRKKIAHDFGLSQSQLVSWLHCISYIRNICAHHSRLWNRVLSVKPEMLKEWKQAGVQGERLYCVFLLLQHLLGQVRPRARWKGQVVELFLSNPQIDATVMQFPSNWMQIEPWNYSNI